MFLLVHSEDGSIFLLSLMLGHVTLQVEWGGIAELAHFAEVRPCHVGLLVSLEGLGVLVPPSARGAVQATSTLVCC